MPGASKPSVLDSVHSSCQRVMDGAAQPWVALAPPDVLQAYAAQLDAAQVKAAAAKGRAVFPIKFDSQEAEITFLALYHLLDFGSGYDRQLRASGDKRGWRETLQFGCFGLALGAKRLDGPWMRAFSPYTLHSAFGIDSKVEEELQPGITISKPGPLAPFAQAIQQAIVETGNALQQAGAKSLGALILEHLDGAKKAGKPITAAGLVEELADSIPGFQDSVLFAPAAAGTAAAPAAADAAGAADAGGGGAAAAASGGGGGDSFRLVFLRKAQALAGELQARFAAEDDRFAWADAASLAADSGAVLPAVLQRLGLLRCSDALLDTLQQHQQQLPAGPEERALRAAAVAAVDAVVAAAAAAGGGSNGGGSSAPFTARDLSCYLLSQVEEEAEGQGGGSAAGQHQELLVFQGAPLRPHVTTGTVAY